MWMVCVFVSISAYKWCANKGDHVNVYRCRITINQLKSKSSQMCRFCVPILFTSLLLLIAFPLSPVFLLYSSRFLIRSFAFSHRKLICCTHTTWNHSHNNCKKKLRLNVGKSESFLFFGVCTIEHQVMIELYTKCLFIFESHIPVSFSPQFRRQYTVISQIHNNNDGNDE